MGKAEKITITNDKGRLTEEEIERMVREAEEFAEEDKKTKERIDAKNAFDGYLHGLKSALEGGADGEPSIGDKMDEDDKDKVKEAMADGQSWMDSNSDADAEDIKEKHQEIEGICAPIISKYYGANGAGNTGAAGNDDDEDDEAHDEL